MNRPATALIVAILVTTVTVAPAAAQTDDSSGLLGVIEDDEGNIDLSEAALAFADRVVYAATSRSPFGDGGPTAGENADAITAAVNEHSDEWATYADSQLGDDVNRTDYDVIEVQTTGSDGETDTLYIVGTVTNGTFETIEAVESTDRTVDYRVELSEYASRKVAGDLDWIYATYVTEDRDIESSARSRFAGKYGPSFVTGDGDINVTEV